MNEQRSHLTDDEIEHYVAEIYGDDPAGSRAIEAHLADCDSCRARHLAAEREHLNVAGRCAKAPHAGCPGETALAQYAAGLCSPETASEVRTHAARCDFCAPLLKEYLEDFSGNLPAEAKDLLQRLPASKPQWRRRFVRNHFPVPHSFPAKNALARLAAWLFTGRGILTAGLAAAVLVSVVTAPLVLDKYKLHHTQELIAKAYQEDRPSEMRLTRVPYAQYDLPRGALPQQTPLIGLPNRVAAAKWASDNRNSTDPLLIRGLGKIALVLQDDSAIDLLEKAKSGGLEDPETEIDLAAAYFQREMRRRAPRDLGMTVDLLNRVLKNSKITPEERATALFDLAIAYENMSYLDQARLAWEQYLEVDPEPGSRWRTEAQEHLDRVRTQIKQQQSGWKDPSFFLHHVSSPEVQGRVENYQDVALRAWLPESTNPGSIAMEAAHTLADFLEGTPYEDPWLKDFLHALQPEEQQAVKALGAAISQNKQGLHTQAAEQAQIARAIFARRGNRPGALRAGFEAVYADQRRFEAQRCLQGARELKAELQNTRYGWLRAQIALEVVSCLYLADQGKSDEAQHLLETALQLAQASHFSAPYLRGLAFTAGIRDPGAKLADNCWEQIAEPVGKGLERYWEGPSAPDRLYEFYSWSKICFSQRRLSYAAEAIERRMIEILEQEIDPEDRNVLFDLSAHLTMVGILKEEQAGGTAETAAQMADAAVEFATKALSLSNKIPEEAVVERYALPIMLDLADLQLERGEIAPALKTLNEVSGVAQSTRADIFRLNFQRLQGDALRADGQFSEAERHYKTGMELAEKALDRVKDEQNRQRLISETGEIYRGLVAVFLEEDKDTAALQLWEWYQARFFKQKTGPPLNTVENSWPQIEQAILQEPLPDVPTRLVYATTRDHLYIWITGTNGLQKVSIPENREHLRQMIRRYLEQCSNKHSGLGALEDYSKELFTLLLKPVIGDLKGAEPVVIDLDPAMSGLALETLKSPEGWYFGQKYEVLRSPGFLTEQNLRSPVRQPYQSGLILDSGDLVRSEREGIVRLFPDIQSWNGSDPSGKELTQRLGDHELFIFIGHGKAGALLVGNSELLNQQNFPPKALQHLRLAVLAACSTGVAEYGLLDTNNLVHAFLVGGTSSVVASQWDVDSNATADLMRAFFAQLKNGDSVALALLRARQQVFKDHPHPYYWGAFTAIGRAG